MKHGLIKRQLDTIIVLLNTTFALLFILVGVDKFFNIITQWQQFINPMLLHVMPLSVSSFLHIFGLIQIIIGIAFLSRWHMQAMYAGLLMLIVILINLVFMRQTAIVLVHDLFMIFELLILIQVTQLRKHL